MTILPDLRMCVHFCAVVLFFTYFRVYLTEYHYYNLFIQKNCLLPKQIYIWYFVGFNISIYVSRVEEVNIFAFNLSDHLNWNIFYFELTFLIIQYLKSKAEYWRTGHNMQFKGIEDMKQMVVLQVHMTNSSERKFSSFT